MGGGGQALEGATASLTPFPPMPPLNVGSDDLTIVVSVYPPETTTSVGYPCIRIKVDHSYKYVSAYDAMVSAPKLYLQTSRKIIIFFRFMNAEVVHQRSRQ